MNFGKPTRAGLPLDRVAEIAGVKANTVNPMASGTGVVGTNSEGKIWYSPYLQTWTKLPG